MSSTGNGDGVVRIGRKGKKKFAFGDGPVFEVDVVEGFRQWVEIDDSFRPPVDGTEDQDRSVPAESLKKFHAAAVDHVRSLAGMKQDEPLTTAEALDFMARLREQYDELVDFFQPHLKARGGSRDSSQPGLEFSEEESSSQTSTKQSSGE